MNEGHSSRKKRQWLDRIGQALLREPQDRKQLVKVIKDAEHRHLLDADALEMIEGVLEVSETHAGEIMVPRSKMVVVEIDDKPEEFIPAIIESGHSRFPVVGENRDEILGLLLAKDLLRYKFDSGRTFNIKDVLRPVLFIPEGKHLDALLRDFRQNRNHMAIVVDEYGGVAGLVTIEDVLEQIVGDISDEHDEMAQQHIIKINENSYTVHAQTPIEDFNEYFHCDFDNEEFTTIGGIVVNLFGHLPERGERVELKGYRFEITQADKRRVRQMRITVPENSQSDSIL